MLANLQHASKDVEAHHQESQHLRSKPRPCINAHSIQVRYSLLPHDLELHTMPKKECSTKETWHVGKLFNVRFDEVEMAAISVMQFLQLCLQMINAFVLTQQLAAGVQRVEACTKTWWPEASQAMRLSASPGRGRKSALGPHFSSSGQIIVAITIPGDDARHSGVVF